MYDINMQMCPESRLDYLHAQVKLLYANAHSAFVIKTKYNIIINRLINCDYQVIAEERLSRMFSLHLKTFGIEKNTKNV